MKTLIGLILVIPFLIWGGVRWRAEYVLTRDCTGHLKLAADANSLKLARQELQTAITYLEQNNYTKGSTAIIFNNPSKDVGFFYNNLVSTRDTVDVELKRTNISELEISNVLMKLRETVLDHGEKGDQVTQPPGLAVFPNNLGMAVWGWVSALIATAGAILIFVGLHEFSEERRYW